MDGIRYDRHAPRRPTSLTLNQDLVRKAQALGGDLSERVERLLARDIEASPDDRSLDAAIDGSNDLIARFGLIGDEVNDGRFG